VTTFTCDVNMFSVYCKQVSVETCNNAQCVHLKNKSGQF